MSERVRIGVAGAGVFGSHHAAKYEAHRGAELCAIYDPDLSRAERLAERFGTDACAQFATVLDAVDAVVVAAPAIAHFELAIAGLRAGRHVFVEKPIAARLDQAKMLASAVGPDQVLQVGHQERYVAAAAGLLGLDAAPRKVHCVREVGETGRCEDVSAVFDLMVHDIDIVRQMIDSPIDRVAASGDENDIAADVALRDGTAISFRVSRRAARPERRMTLVFEEGIAEFDFLNRSLSNTTPFHLRAPQSDENAPLAFKDPLAVGADHFIRAIQDKVSPIVTGADGRDAVAWAERIEEALGFAIDRGDAMEERLRA